MELKMERDILKKSAQHLIQERSIRFEFIQKHRDVYSIEKMCQILKVSRSVYYYWINKKPSNRLIRPFELGVFTKNVYDWSKGRYGSPRITKELQMQGIVVSRPLVSRIMKKKNLRSVRV